MKSLVLFILSAIALFGCSTQNPNPNNNNSSNYSYTQGANLIDVDGNVYPTFITSCGQTWMQKNLNVSHYRNGDVIPQVTDQSQWINLTTGAWCYYNNDPILGAIYGKLYNWYAVNDPRGLAPSGWHVPTNSNWDILLKCIDPNANLNCPDTTVCNSAGSAMKINDTSFWNNPNVICSNRSGFFGLPGGCYIAPFLLIKTEGIWWSSSPYDNGNAWSRSLDEDYDDLYKGHDTKFYGFSVRCIKD